MPSAFAVTPVALNVPWSPFLNVTLTYPFGVGSVGLTITAVPSSYCAVISVGVANIAFNGLFHAFAPVFCFQPSFAVTVGAGTVTSFVGFTQYLVVPDNVPWSPGRNFTSTKFAGTSGLSLPGCGTTSSEYVALNVV